VSPAPGLDRAIEVVLMAGLVSSAALLLFGLLGGDPGVLRLGILLLMVTPAGRVVVLSIGLLRQRDFLFGLLSLWILAVLGLSMLIGARLL